ncbi:hypothetical protein LCGC14_2129830, partial [marine sediment metagenome]
MSGLIFAFLISIVCVSCYQAWSIRHAFNSKRKHPNALARDDFLCKVDATPGACRQDGWTFSVMIRGKVTAPFEGCDADVRVLIEDVTQRTGGAKAVLCSAKQWQMADSTAFCLCANIGKLAKQWRDQGHRVMLAACDTFRAAAVEQLALWAQRLGTDIIK